MPKHSKLQDKLAKSLHRPTPPKAATRKPTAALPPAKGEGIARKISISLHPTDLAKVEGIRSYLAGVGKHITTSEAIKLALRTVKVGSDLAGHLADLEAEDKRRKG